MHKFLGFAWVFVAIIWAISLIGFLVGNSEPSRTSCIVALVNIILLSTLLAVMNFKKGDGK